jgi:hypothetical protein
MEFYLPNDQFDRPNAFEYQYIAERSATAVYRFAEPKSNAFTLTGLKHSLDRYALNLYLIPEESGYF